MIITKKKKILMKKITIKIKGTLGTNLEKRNIIKIEIIVLEIGEDTINISVNLIFQTRIHEKIIKNLIMKVKIWTAKIITERELSLYQKKTKNKSM